MSKGGIYAITGYYEADASTGGKPTGPIPFWGGQIATPPVEIRVGRGEFKAPAPEKIKGACGRAAALPPIPNHGGAPSLRHHPICRSFRVPWP